MTTSIKWRFIIFLIILIIALALTLLITSRILENNMLHLRISDSAQKANDFSMTVAYDLSRNNAENLYKMAVEKGMDLNGRVLILDELGIVQVDSFSRLNGVQLSHREVWEVLVERKDSAYGFHRIPREEGRIWSLNYVSAIIENSEIVGAVVLVQSVQDVVQSVHSIQGSYYAIYLAVICILLVVFSFLINHILQPMRALKAGTEAISRGDFSRRVQVTGKDELATLAEAFNTMAVRLEDVDRSRNEFVSNASHELKTPLTSMKILTESILYEDGVEESVYKDFLGDINREIDRMTALINDLLLMTKLQNIEEGKVQMESVSLDQMTEHVLQNLRLIAEMKHITLHQNLHFKNEVDCLPTYLQHAISNLVDNAIKYTADGGDVYVSTLKEGNMACVRVRDTGEGIAKAEQEKIFERFYRVSKSRARETGGTGLGLYIVQTTALLHNGRIEVESVEGKGSTFTLMIPLGSGHHERRKA